MFARTFVVLTLALAACGAPGALPGADQPGDHDPVIVDPATDDSAPLDAPDLGAAPRDLAECDHARPAPDLAQQPAPDLAQLGPDLAERPRDLQPAPDLEPGCGGMGQPCCSRSCDQGLLCLVEGELCGAQIPRACVAPLNCGGRGLPPCDDLGKPSPFGRCIDGLRVYAGKCASCLP